MAGREDCPRLDPGESALPRKKNMSLHMEANVYEQATNLMPPEPPLPSPEPAPPVGETVTVVLPPYAESWIALPLESWWYPVPNQKVSQQKSRPENTSGRC